MALLNFGTSSATQSAAQKAAQDALNEANKLLVEIRDTKQKIATDKQAVATDAATVAENRDAVNAVRNIASAVQAVAAIAEVVSDIDGLGDMRAEAAASASAASADRSTVATDKATVAADKATIAGWLANLVGNVLTVDLGSVSNSLSWPVKQIRQFIDLQKRDLDTIASAIDYHPITAPQFLRAAGHTLLGKGSAQYAKRNSQPSHAGKFSITLADGLSVVWYELAEQKVNQYMFGAVGDGVADDTMAIKNMLAYCEATGAFPDAAYGSHKITDTIQIKVSCDLRKMSIVASNISAVLVGSRGLSDEVIGVSVMLGSIINTGKIGSGGGWGGAIAGTIGVEFANLYESRLYATEIRNFAVGAWVSAYSTGNAYNTYDFGSLSNNQVNLLLKPANDAGWVNENVFSQGRLLFYSGEGSNVAGTRNVQLVESSPTAANGPPNNNRFRLSIEGSTPEFHVDVQGAENVFDCRWEAVPPRVRHYTRTAGQTANNLFIGYGAYNITHTFDGLASVGEGSIHPRRLSFQGAANPTVSLSNGTSGSRTGPHARGYTAGKQPIAKVTADADWNWELWAQGLAGKRDTDAADRVLVDWNNSRLYFGGGATAPVAYIGQFGSTLGFSHHIGPTTDNAVDIGYSTHRARAVYAVQYRMGTSGAVIVTSGSGSPEGVVTAPVGSLYTRTDGGAGTTLYVKESGSGNTGWVAK